MSAAYYAQFVLNGGKPVGSSIPATEHRWGAHDTNEPTPHTRIESTNRIEANRRGRIGRTEIDAANNMIDRLD
eukprot:6943665-Pyramimonas_sp.AAC.1